MPEDTGFYIDDACIPHTWYPAEAARNAQLVVTYDAAMHLVAVDTGNHIVQDLGVAIVDARNTRVGSFKTPAAGARYLESNYVAKSPKL